MASAMANDIHIKKTYTPGVIDKLQMLILHTEIWVNRFSPAFTFTEKYYTQLSSEVAHLNCLQHLSCLQAKSKILINKMELYTVLITGEKFRFLFFSYYLPLNDFVYQ